MGDVGNLMKTSRRKYVVSEVPSNMVSGCKERLYYCHMEGFPRVPVFGSIGSKAKAKKIADLYNKPVVG